MESAKRTPTGVDTILSKKQFDVITEHLSALAEKLRITTVLLVSSSGQRVAEKASSRCRIDSTVLSALTASSFMASKEMARIVGEENQFRMVLHEGKSHHVFTCSVTNGFFLIVVFESGVALGMVRLFTKKTVVQLRSVLSAQNEDGADAVFDRRFQTLLGEELDRSLRSFS